MSDSLAGYEGMTSWKYKDLFFLKAASGQAGGELDPSALGKADFGFGNGQRSTVNGQRSMVNGQRTAGMALEAI